MGKFPATFVPSSPGPSRPPTRNPTLGAVLGPNPECQDQTRQVEAFSRHLAEQEVESRDQEADILAWLFAMDESSSPHEEFLQRDFFSSMLPSNNPPPTTEETTITTSMMPHHSILAQRHQGPPSIPEPSLSERSSKANEQHHQQPHEFARVPLPPHISTEGNRKAGPGGICVPVLVRTESGQVIPHDTSYRPGSSSPSHGGSSNIGASRDRDTSGEITAGMENLNATIHTNQHPSINRSGRYRDIEMGQTHIIPPVTAEMIREKHLAFEEEIRRKQVQARQTAQGSPPQDQQAQVQPPAEGPGFPEEPSIEAEFDKEWKKQQLPPYVTPVIQKVVDNEIEESKKKVYSGARSANHHPCGFSCILEMPEEDTKVDFMIRLKQRIEKTRFEAGSIFSIVQKHTIVAPLSQQAISLSITFNKGPESYLTESAALRIYRARPQVRDRRYWEPVPVAGETFVLPVPFAKDASAAEKMAANMFGAMPGNPDEVELVVVPDAYLEGVWDGNEKVVRKGTDVSLAVVKFRAYGRMLSALEYEREQ